MSWIMTTEEYREWTICRQVCTNPDLEEGDIITVEIAGVEERFESMDEARDYLDELVDEMEAKADRARCTSSWFDHTATGRMLARTGWYD
jgi:hypothetical protein